MKILVPLLLLASVILVIKIPLASGAANLKCWDGIPGEEVVCQDKYHATADWICEWRKGPDGGIARKCALKCPAKKPGCRDVQGGENCYCESDFCNKDKQTALGLGAKTDSNSATSLGGSSLVGMILVISLGLCRQVGFFGN